MSLADTTPNPHPTRRRGATGRLLRSELRLVFGRRRNQVLLVALGLVPVLVGVAVKVAGGPGRSGEGPAFLSQVSSNGLFLVFTSLVVSLPLFLPLAVGIISGDAIAGEASTGTLRYLLTVPVSRPRLLLTKAFGAMIFTAAAVCCAGSSTIRSAPCSAPTSSSHDAFPSSSTRRSTATPTGP